MVRTFYDILMVSNRADRAVISVVYRHLAKRFHPDKDATPEAAARMAELNEAYAILSDPAKRVRYDEQIGLRKTTPAVGPGDSRPSRRGTVNTVSTTQTEHGEAGAPPSNPAPSGRPLAFGRYRGWTLNQVARYDFDYIEWLSRTTMGRNFKRELDDLLHR